MSLPGFEPMLAVPWDRIFAGPGWSFELKWDGVRSLVGTDGTAVRLRGRRGSDMTARYPELGAVSLPRPMVLDGEIVATNEDGSPSFERLQRRMHLGDRRTIDRAMAEVPVTLVVFDLLALDGLPLISEPWASRRERLASLRLPQPLVRADVVIEDGPALWDAVTGRGLEGVVAKRLESPYRPGIRSPDWRKIPNVRLLKAVVGGFTPGEGGRSSSFGSLLLGLWEGERLRWVGSVGTGFTDRDLVGVRSALDEMTRPGSPFHPDADLPDGSTWVLPSLVASVGFREWTSAGRLRHPRFRGFTDDPTETITWQAEGPGGAPAG